MKLNRPGSRKSLWSRFALNLARSLSAFIHPQSQPEPKTVEELMMVRSGSQSSGAAIEQMTPPAEAMLEESPRGRGT